MFDMLLRDLAPGLVILTHVLHDSMLFTILSMSDWHGMCFLITDNGVSIGTSAWCACVYAISGGL